MLKISDKLINIIFLIFWVAGPRPQNWGGSVWTPMSLTAAMLWTDERLWYMIASPYYLQVVGLLFNYRVGQKTGATLFYGL